jgi:hypothetical protein
MIPLTIRFDSADNVSGANVVRLPKLCQGAPYDFALRVRKEDMSYRDWAEVEGARWRIKLSPADRAQLMELTMANGNLVVDGDELHFVVKATDWAEVELPQSPNHMELDVPFSFTIEFLDDAGVVIERFAQGTGLITVDLAADLPPTPL